MISGWLLGAMAWAQAPIISDEVDVYGEARIDAARQKVVETLEQFGYDDVRVRDGRTIYRNDEAWRGQVVLYDDGFMVMERQPVRVVAPALPFAEENSPLAWMGCLIYAPACLRPGGQLIGKRKFRGNERKVVGYVHHDVEAWADRIADAAVGRKINALPDRMQALWDEGIGLEDGEIRSSYAERRQELLRFWASRTDTPWGEAVREAVEAFCLGVVQPSDHPFTRGEVEAFNRTSRASRPFPIPRSSAASAPPAAGPP